MKLNQKYQPFFHPSDRNFRKNLKDQWWLPYHCYQLKIMEELKAFFPSACPHCDYVGEADFPTSLGFIHCENCGKQLGYVPIIKLPDIDTIKLQIWHLSNKNIGLLQCLGFHNENACWRDWWRFYLKVRKIKEDKKL